MDKKSNSTLISGILGTSNAHHQRNSDGVPMRRPEDNISSKGGNYVESNQSEQHNKLHRLGSYIDWGASAFDFSNISSAVDIVGNQKSINSTHDSYNTSFQNSVPADFPIHQKTTFNNLGRQNSISDTDVSKRLDFAAPYEKNEASIPTFLSGKSIKRRHSLRDNVEQQYIEAFSQAVLSNDTSHPTVSNNHRTLRSDTEEHAGNSVLGGIMGSWFFRNKGMDDDSAGGAIQRTPEMSMEGIGEGSLTSKVVSALNLNPTSKTDGGTMNTWMPASF